MYNIINHLDQIELIELNDYDTIYCLDYHNCELTLVEVDTMEDQQIQDFLILSNESKQLKYKLKINGVVQDLSDWEIELYLGGALFKTVNEITDQNTVGIIQNQTTNKGEFFFTILSSDIASYIQCTKNIVKARLRFITNQIPTYIFSNVYFNFIILDA